PDELNEARDGAMAAARALGHYPAWAAVSVAGATDPSAAASQDVARAAVPGGGPVWEVGRAPEFKEERAAQCDHLRDIFANPFRPTPPIAPSVLEWHGGTVRRLAEDAYENRTLPGGHLDPARLAVLADALEEAG